MKTNNTLCLLDSAPAGEIQSRYLRRDLESDGVCTITFDRADSAANILDPDLPQPRIHEIRSELGFLSAQSKRRMEP